MLCLLQKIHNLHASFHTLELAAWFIHPGWSPAPDPLSLNPQVMPIPPSLITFLVGMALVLAGLWLGQNISLLPLDASLNAPVYDELFKVLFSIGSVLFIGILGLLLFSLVRFRRRPGDNSDGAPIEGNLPLEIVWTAIPAVVVLFIGIYSYDIYDRMGGMTPLNDHGSMAHASMSMETGSAMQAANTSSSTSPKVWGGIGLISGKDVLPIDLTALQFAFIFHYPNANITSGELHIPTNKSVELRMHANDVIHAFWVPQFRLKQDVIPGQETILTFTATRPGTYPIVCAELCGPYHGGMRSSVVVHEPEEFDAWIQKNSPAIPVPTSVAHLDTTPTA
jgi:cytochrome c oxidase subunit 2